MSPEVHYQITMGNIVCEYEKSYGQIQVNIKVFEKTNVRIV